MNILHLSVLFLVPGQTMSKIPSNRYNMKGTFTNDQNATRRSTPSLGLQENVTRHRSLVFNGHDVVDPSKFPFYTRLSFCGGSLVHSDIVLTAAHCPNSTFVEVATIGQGGYIRGLHTALADNTTITRRVDRQVIHPNYTFLGGGRGADIKLVKLKMPVNDVSAVALNRDPLLPSISGAQLGTILGQGQTEQGFFASMLQEAGVLILPHDKCIHYYGTAYSPTFHICATGIRKDSGSCLGDSGSPLLIPKVDTTTTTVSWIVVGVTSFILDRQLCGKIPVIYERVSGSSDWIDEEICTLSSEPPSWCHKDDDDKDSETKNVGYCFSGDALVRVAKDDGVSLVPMKQVKVNDQVLVWKRRNGFQFERIYAFGHRDESMKAEFIQLLPSMIELSIQHLIFVVDKGVIPAGKVQVGDLLFMTSSPSSLLKPNRKLSASVVSGIRRINRKGVYAPFTPSGTIVVNDVVASNYVSLWGDDGTIRSFPTHWQSHLFQAPHRIWCSLLGGQGSCGENDGDGFSSWTRGPYKFVEWSREGRFRRFIFWIVFFSLLPFLYLIAILEYYASLLLLACWKIKNGM